MITRPYLISLALTAITWCALPLCWGSLVSMLLWIAMASTWAVHAVATLILLDHLERSQLPDDRGLPEPSRYPPMPEVVPPFRFVGASDNTGRTHRQWPPEDIQ